MEESLMNKSLILTIYSDNIILQNLFNNSFINYLNLNDDEHLSRFRLFNIYNKIEFENISLIISDYILLIVNINNKERIEYLLNILLNYKRLDNIKLIIYKENNLEDIDIKKNNKKPQKINKKIIKEINENIEKKELQNINEEVNEEYKDNKDDNNINKDKDNIDNNNINKDKDNIDNNINKDNKDKDNIDNNDNKDKDNKDKLIEDKNNQNKNNEDMDNKNKMVEDNNKNKQPKSFIKEQIKKILEKKIKQIKEEEIKQIKEEEIKQIKEEEIKEIKEEEIKEIKEEIKEENKKIKEEFKNNENTINNYKIILNDNYDEQLLINILQKNNIKNFNIKFLNEIVELFDFININDNYFKEIKVRSYNKNFILNANSTTVFVLNNDIIDLLSKQKSFYILEDVNDFNKDDLVIPFTPIKKCSVLNFNLYDNLDDEYIKNINDKKMNKNLIESLINQKSTESLYVKCNNISELITISEYLKKLNYDIFGFSLKKINNEELNKIIVKINNNIVDILKYNINKETIKDFYKTLIVIENKYYKEEKNLSSNTLINNNKINLLSFKNIDEFILTIENKLYLLEKKFNKITLNNLKKEESDFLLEFLDNPIVKIKSDKYYCKVPIKIIEGKIKCNQLTIIGKIVKIKTIYNKKIDILHKGDIGLIGIYLNSSNYNLSNEKMKGYILENLIESKVQPLIDNKILSNTQTIFQRLNSKRLSFSIKQIIKI